jgi:hypothetical protein
VLVVGGGQGDPASAALAGAGLVLVLVLAGRVSLLGHCVRLPMVDHVSAHHLLGRLASAETEKEVADNARSHLGDDFVQLSHRHIDQRDRVAEVEQTSPFSMMAFLDGLQLRIAQVVLLQLVHTGPRHRTDEVGIEVLDGEQEAGQHDGLDLDPVLVDLAAVVLGEVAGVGGGEDPGEVVVNVVGAEGQVMQVGKDLGQEGLDERAGEEDVALLGAEPGDEVLDEDAHLRGGELDREQRGGHG